MHGGDYRRADLRGCAGLKKRAKMSQKCCFQASNRAFAQ
jgi:hypothetical protein